MKEKIIETKEGNPRKRTTLSLGKRKGGEVKGKIPKFKKIQRE
jgi:hypothetical protein